MRDTGPLKLRAHDREDLATLAACLQDALVPLADIAFLKAEKRFVLIANRFKWENAEADAPLPVPADGQGGGDVGFEDGAEEPPYQRVNCAVCFDWVRNVRFRGLESRRKDQILSLLTIEAEPGAVTLVFSDGGAIRLEVSDIRCHLEDLGEPWPTRWRPTHDDAKAPPRQPG